MNAISPGAIYLPEPIELARDYVREENHKESDKRFADRYWDAHRYAQPLERVGEPENIARWAVFLASDDARFITGQNIVVDGGATSKIPYRGQGQPSGKIFTALEEMRSWMGRHARRDR